MTGRAKLKLVVFSRRPLSRLAFLRVLCLQTKGLITWAGLAWLAGLLRCAEMTFSPVLHRVSQPGWWLMRWTAFGAKKARAARYIMAGSYIFKTNTTRMRQMIAIAIFPAAGCITLLHSCSYMDFYFCFFYIERGILICWWLTLRGREIYLLRSARDWNYPLFSGWLSVPGWPGKGDFIARFKGDYMKKFQPG